MVAWLSLYGSILALWLPASLQSLTDWSRPLLFNIFVSRNVKASHLEDTALELDAVGLSVMSLNLLLFATAYGFNGAIDSYASVAYGARDERELRAVLIRQFVLLGGLSLLAVFLFANAEVALKFIGLPDELAERSAELLSLMSWAVPGDFAYDCIGRWLRGQQLHRLVAACSLSALGLNIMVNIAFASEVQPTRAPLLALIAQNTYLPFALLGSYACLGQPAESSTTRVQPLGSKEGVPEPSMVSLVFGPELRRQGQIGLAAMVWTCAELWAWELQVFEASALGTGNAAAYTLLSSTYSLLITAFPVSVASGASALIGEALGRGDPARATQVLQAACTLTLGLLCLYTIPVGLGRGAIATLLSGGVDEVRDKYTHALPLILAMHFLDGLFNVLKQWLTVRKKQAFGAVMSLIVYYGFGVPLGYWLAWHAGWGLVGLWAGLGASVLLGCVTTALQAVHDIETSLILLPADMEPADEPDAYHSFDDPEAAAAASPLAARLHSCGPALLRRLRLLVFIVPGVILFLTAVLWVSPSGTHGLGVAIGQTAGAEIFVAREANSPVWLGYPALLDGAAPCAWSSGGGFYHYPFNAFFNRAAGDYGWEVSIADKSKATESTDAGRRLSAAVPSHLVSYLSMRVAVAQLHRNPMREAEQLAMTGGGLRFGLDRDVYDKRYTHVFDEEVEVGWAVWLRPPEISPSVIEEAGGWTSRAFVGTRVSTATHTFCGCQFMRGGKRTFRLTEHGRAQVDFGEGRGVSAPPWYLNLTRGEINAQIAATCLPYAGRTVCPGDNETAWAEWAAAKDNGTYWVVPPWVEVYSGLPRGRV